MHLYQMSVLVPLPHLLIFLVTILKPMILKEIGRVSILLIEVLQRIIRNILAENKDFFPIKPMDYDKFLVLSLGTGSAKIEEKFGARDSSKWGILGWLHNKRRKSLIKIFQQDSADMVDIHASILFQVLHSEKNYLRIQDDTLTGSTSSTDISTTKNLLDLVHVGKDLLKKPLSRVNLDTGTYEPVNGKVTNEEALTHFARLLSEERRQRKMAMNDVHED